MAGLECLFSLDFQMLRRQCFEELVHHEPMRLAEPKGTVTPRNQWSPHGTVGAQGAIQKFPGPDNRKQQPSKPAEIAAELGESRD